MWLLQEDSVLGKLRIRLSTLRPWEEVCTQLPMLSDRDKGGTKVGQAHISLKVSLFLLPPLVPCPLQPPLRLAPSGLVTHQLVEARAVQGGQLPGSLNSAICVFPLVPVSIRKTPDVGTGCLEGERRDNTQVSANMIVLWQAPQPVCRQISGTCRCC